MSSGRKPAAGSAKTANKSVVELVKEATGASEEEIAFTLQECGYDVNLATNKLIDGGTFSSVVNKRQKKKQREEERRNSQQREAAAAAPKVLEVRRQPSAGGPSRDRGGRGGGRGARGGGRGGGPPSRPAPTVAADSGQEATRNTTETPQTQDAEQASPASQPADPPPPLYTAPPAAAVPVGAQLPPGPIKPSEGGSMSMAERLFKQQQRPQVAPAAIAAARNEVTPQQPPEQAPTPPQPHPQQAVASQPELGTSDPVVEKGAAVAAQAHALVSAPIASDLPISNTQVAPQQPQVLAVNGGTTLQQPAAPAQDAAALQQQQQDAQQHVPQHDAIAPGPQGLGGVPVQPPPRQSAFADTSSSDPAAPAANAWGAVPQKPVAQAAPGPNLGSSLMASLSAGVGGGAGGLAQPSPALSDPAIVSHSLGGSANLGALTGSQQDAAKPPVILPPSAQQATDSGVDRVRLQFGQFGVGGDYGSGFSSTVSAPQHSEPQPTTFQQQASNFAAASYGSQPPHALQTGGQQPVQQPQQQGDQLGPGLQSVPPASTSFKSSGLDTAGNDLSSAVQQQGQQNHHAPTQQHAGQQSQRPAASAGFSQQRPPSEQQTSGPSSVQRTGGQYGAGGYGDLSGYNQQYGQQYGGAFAQGGQYDAFSAGSLAGDKRSSFDATGYGGFQSNLGGGYGQPQGQGGKPADLQNAGSTFGQGSDASAAGSQAQTPQLHQAQGYGPPGMGGYGYPQAAQYGYQGYGLAPPNYYMHPSAGAYQSYGAPQQPQGGYGGGPSRPKQQPQQYSGYASQGSAGGYGGLKDATGGASGMAGQPTPDANPYAGASAAYQMQGQYSGYGVPQGRQQSNFGAFGGYNAGGYGSYGQMQGQAPNGDSFKMQ